MSDMVAMTKAFREMGDNLTVCLNELDKWKARAEAAEEELKDAMTVIDLYQSRMFAAEDRVAELEVRLAEQAWRPVTEDAPTYMIVDLLVTGYNTEDGYRVGPDNTDVIKAWRPSQPEPAATE